MSWISRLGNAFRSSRTAADLEAEFQFHIDQRTQDLMQTGLSRTEAELAARRQFGGRLRLRESSHEVKSAMWFESLFCDFRFGLRMLSKYRAASFAAIASLALAIGACTAAFSLLDALMLRPLPVRDPHQLFDLARVFPPFMSPNNQPREFDVFSYPQFTLLRDAVRGSADLFIMDNTGGLQSAQFDGAGGVTESVRPCAISGEGFNILGVKPALGRLIQPDDDSLADPHDVAVLSYPFWKRHYGGSPSTIGRTVTFWGKTFQIIGVAQRNFTGGQPGYLIDLWVPKTEASDPRLLAEDIELASVWGRAHAGVDRSQIRQRLQPVFTNALRERLRINPPRNFHGDQLKQFGDQPLILRDASRGSGRGSLFRAQFRRPFEILALICALLLLLACSNVGNLLLARASARDAEMALRTSLGAARSRLIQQMLIESSQLAVIATALALIFAALAAGAIVARLGPSELPAFLDVGPDSRSLAFAAGLSVLSTILFGLAPALHASSMRPEAALKRGAMQQSTRIGSLRWMLAAQIGFSVAVLFLSGLLLLSFRKLMAVDPGFTRDNVVLFDLAPRDAFNRRLEPAMKLLEHIRSLPGVQAASLTAQRPMGGDMVWIMTPFVRFAGRASENIRPIQIPVSDGFFNAMRIHWIAGRDFLPEEMAGSSASAIVNQAFVDTFLPGKNPLGEIFDTIGDSPNPVHRQIVGVARTMHYNNLRQPDRATIYTPLPDATRATLNIRVGSTSASTLEWLRQEIESSAPALMVTNSILLKSQVDNTLISERLLALLAGFFSTVALLLAAIGLYGVINFAAVRRTREIGIRIALGARRTSVVRLMVSNTSFPVAAGIALGVLAAITLARYLASQLFDVKPTDFWSLAAPIAIILLAALAASLPPAVRAARADPVIALRHE